MPTPSTRPAHVPTSLWLLRAARTWGRQIADLVGGLYWLCARPFRQLAGLADPHEGGEDY